MTTSEFLSDLREREIRLWIEGVDSLRYEAPPGSLTPYLLSELRSRKLEILEFLRRAHDADVVERPIDPVDRDEPLPLSFAQQRLWFLDRLGTGPGYNIPMTMRLRGELDIEALRESLDTVVERHEVLRTTFEETDDGPVQRIAPTLHIPMPVEDLNGFDEDERMEAARRRARDEAMESFDLATGPVLRARLLELDAEDHVLLLTMHHIATDGWSMGVLTRELMESYRAFIRGDEPELAELPIQYADFAHWQRAWLQGEVFERQLAYWKDRLGGAPRLDLPTDHPRPAVQTYAGSGHRFSIGLEVYESIKRLSRAHGVTPAITLMAAFRVLLSRYTGQEDIVLGSPIANRNRKEIENLIGFFVNTLALRVDLAGNPTFVELLRRERDSSLAAYDHQDFPFERLVEELDPERDLSQNPIFQVTFSVQNTPGEPLKLPGLLVKPFDLGTVTTTRFDLELQVGEIRNGLYASFSYNTDLFNASTIERMADHYAMLLEAIVADPDARLLELPLLDDEERCQVVDVWNRTSRSFPSDKCVHELFEAQVERTPDHLAVAFNGASLTYRELDARANQLAHALIARRVGAESRVGICVERSLEMVIGLLGILKAGGAYVPIDPSHPAQRRALVVNDAGASLVLTRQEDADTFADVDAGVISLDAAWSVIARSSADAPLPCSGPGNLAYVIYTSGSTGRPKGVCVTHAGLSNYLAWSTDAYGLEAGCVSLVHSSISFDLTVTSLLGPLVVGGTAHLVPDAPGVEALAAAVRGVPRVDLLKITPAHVELLSQELSADERAGIGTLVIGGEALTARHVALWEGSGVRSTLVNEYGPTETVVGVSIYRVPPGAPRSGSVPIGRPVANTQIYVVDKKFQPVPIGIPGELLIGGIQVARGYHGRSDLTAERFVPDPFAMKSGARLYRTGDIARYDTDGSIEFKGRMDHQVKIRGFRIELGEIEYALEAHPDVREAFAVVQDGPSGEPGLVAYIVPAGSDGPEPAALREWLGERLPAYMLPWALVTMQAWPLTPNGKIDQRALPRPGRPESGKSHVAPRTQTERVLCEIWSDVLGVEKIGIDDNFLDLGGHSMLIMTALRRTEQRLGVRIGLESYFIKTLKAVAAQYDQALASNVPPPRRKQRLAARMVDMIARIRGKEGSASRVPR